MLMEMYMKDNGKMIKPMDMESIPIKMELNMKENGLKINNMEMELKLGQMVLDMKDNMKWVKNIIKENSTGLIHPCTLETFSITTFMDTEPMNGLMVENM